MNNPHAFAAELVRVAHGAWLDMDNESVAAIVADMPEADLRRVLHSVAHLAGRLAYDLPDERRRAIIDAHGAFQPVEVSE